MAVEGKTILQTTERTELTGKEGIPFQEGTQNGHVLLEKIKEYIQEGSSNNSVHLFKGVCDIDESSNPAEIKEALGVDSVNDLMTLAQKGTVFVDETNNSRYNTCSVYVLNNVIMISWLESEYPGLTNLKLNVSGSSSGDVFSFNSIEKLTVPLVEDNLNSEYPDSALSANQGRILNEKIAEISNPASAEKDGLMSKEDKEAFDNMKDGGAIEYKEISGQTVDADDLIVPKLTVRYLNKNASTAENISNIPAKGGFVLESMCVRYVDEDNCGYIQTYYSQNSDSRILPFSLTRQYTNGKWTEWRSTVGRYLCVNEAYEKVGTTFLGTGFQVGNIFDRSIVKDGALAISTQDVALHLTGVKNSTTYKVVSNSSVGYWMMKNCPEQFFHAGKVAVSEDKTSESDETKKEYVAEVVSVAAA